MNEKVVKLSIDDYDPSGSACCSVILCIFAYASMYQVFNLNYANSLSDMVKKNSSRC